MRLAGLVAVGVAGLMSLTASARAQNGLPIVGNAGQFGAAQGQQRVLAPVTGHVTCSDTQRPARFATVMLVGGEILAGSGPNVSHDFGRRVMARTDLDGNFSTQAEPGDYYVTATETGYASPIAEAAARLRAGASVADLLASLPVVHVAEAGGGSVNVTLDRGAVIAGHLQWDDGSPAAGVNVSAQSTSSGNGRPSDLMRVVSELGGGFAGMGGLQSSDDRGAFRITGLPPGSYWVRAMVLTPSGEPGSSMGRTTSLVMYAPGKMRRSDAQVLTLKSGEERDDVQFTLDLSALHTVSGHVSATDGATIAAGIVRLTDTNDSSLTRVGVIQSDGGFSVQWIPAGTYTLQVSNASNIPIQGFGRRGQTQAGTSYQPFQESLTVTDSDLSGVNLTLTPASSGQ